MQNGVCGGWSAEHGELLGSLRPHGDAAVPDLLLLGLPAPCACPGLCGGRVPTGWPRAVTEGMRVEWRPPASAASPSRGADQPRASPWSREVGRGPSSISRCAIPGPQEQSQCQQLGAIKHNLQFSGQCKHCSQQLQALLLPGVAGLLAADAGFSGAAQIPPCPSPKVKKDCTRITRGGDQGKHLSGFLITFLLSAFWVMKHVFMPGLPSVHHPPTSAVPSAEQEAQEQGQAH